MIEQLLKRIPSAPNYGATVTGDIVRLATARGARVGYVLKPYKLPNGYFYVHISEGTNGRAYRRVNRLACEAWHGPPPSPNHVAAHLNGNCLDNRPENLAWKTHKENAADKVLHGTVSQGEAHGLSKLTDAIVIDIRARHADGTLHIASEAERLGVCYQTVHGVVTGRTWRHVGNRPTAPATALRRAPGPSQLELSL